MTFEPGDIAACHARDWSGQAIRWGTVSLLAPKRLRLGPSHVAVLFRHEGEMVWGESTTLCGRPCRVHRTQVTGAQAHRPDERIADYVNDGGRVDLFRLTPINRLSEAESQLLTRILLKHFIEPGVGYDLGGALLSGTRMLQRSRMFPIADLHTLFCSELVAALVMRLNRMNHANPSRFHPARLLRELVKTGKYELIETFGEEP